MLKKIRSILSSGGNRNVGYLAEFSDPGALVEAVKALRKKGYAKLDTFTPFPVHGMDRAMGLSTSKLGYIIFLGGATGLALGWWLQWWTSAVDFSINISNKPFFAIESSVPIMFELTVLFSALTAVGAMLALNGLPRPYNPLFNSRRFARVTDDGFFLQIGNGDSDVDREEVVGDLVGLGAMHVEYVDHEGATSLYGTSSSEDSTESPAQS